MSDAADQLDSNLRRIADTYDGNMFKTGPWPDAVAMMLGLCAILTVERPEVWGVFARRYASGIDAITLREGDDPRRYTEELLRTLMESPAHE